MQRRSVELRRQEQTILFVTWVIVVVIGAASTTMAQDAATILEDSLIKVVERTEPSVVSIARVKLPPQDVMIDGKHRAFGLRIEPLRDDSRPREVETVPNEFGAGFLISPPNSSTQFILTNHHVVRGGPISSFRREDGTELQIRFSDRRGCRAAIIAADPRSDLAVLCLDWERSGFKPNTHPSLNWETATPPRKGQFVILLGNPYLIARDGSASVSWGIISNLTRQPVSSARVRNQFPDQEEQTNRTMLYRLGAVMQLDARLNLGTSGGPVLNLKGELIGISTSLAAIEGYDQSVGFAIPIDPMTRRIVRTLLAGQEVEYGMLGIDPDDFPPERFIGLNTGLPQRSAARVSSVQKGSPADIAGIIPEDIIVKVENEPIRGVADLMRVVGLHPPDSEIHVILWRERLETVKITLGKWPVRDEEGIVETNPRYLPWRGLSVDYPSARNRYIYGLPDFKRVLVTKVLDKTPCHDAQLEPGNFITHVNGKPVQTPAQFYAAVKAAPGSVELRLADDGGDFGNKTTNGRIVHIHE